MLKNDDIIAFIATTQPEEARPDGNILSLTQFR